MEPSARDLRLLFIGDIVGDAGLDLLDEELPALRVRLRPDFVIANAENASLTGENPVGGAGMTRGDVARLRALGVDAITGGNHSWDSAEAVAALEEPEVVRPLNVTGEQPGRGALVVARDGARLGVVSLVSATAMEHVEPPFEALARQLERWSGDAVDLVLVDFHTADARSRSRAWASRAEPEAAVRRGARGPAPVRYALARPRSADAASLIGGRHPVARP
ncbi:MAG: YmdB family metallophosphoesterase [Deinococcales bacterium]